LTNNWNVIFDDRHGHVEHLKSDTLADWTTSDDERIKHFSGTASYTTSFKMKPQGGKRYILKFATLHDVARVTVNGNEAGIVWCSPFEIDITDYLERGKNILKIDVTNSLYNRMIGDTVLPESERTTWATTPIVTKDTPLLPSGMEGVSILSF
jgi:hypothetical protein